MKIDTLELKNKVSDFISWISEKEVTYINATSKKITVSLNGTCRVYKNNKVVLKTLQPASAIIKFLEI